MVRLVRKISKKAGLPPGTPVFTGDRKIDKVKIIVIDYDKDSFDVKETATVDECLPYRKTPTVTWIDITGLHEVPVIERLGESFGVHPLVLEDILNIEQRPKMDMFDDHVFIVLRMNTYDSGRRSIVSEQVSLIFGRNFVITFQEKEGDVFDAVRNRLAKNRGRIRKAGPDYLAYALMDAVVDNYFKVLEGIGEAVENMEDEVVANPVPDTLRKIHELKRETILLRKSVWPLRELVGGLERDDTVLVKKATKIYLRDLYDHTIQVIDTVETYRDIISGLLDVYLSSISNKMNEIMKVLTIFAAIFIPLTFVAGIYGMNFNPERSPLNMPELNWYAGYPFALGLMAGIAVVMIVFFRRKKWM